MPGAVLVFDIETIPDIAALRAKYGITADVADDQVADMVRRERRQNNLNEFLPHIFHEVAVISYVLSHPTTGLHVRSLESYADDSDEAAVIARFFHGIEKFKPQLVTWNGAGFDLPVLHYRSMKYGIAAPAYWEMGNGDKEMKWNNYINRYHERHLDLMDILALYQFGPSAKLDDLAKLCGFPGKIGMDGAQVEHALRRGEHDEVSLYCECDALNTYLLYLRFCRFRGLIDEARERQHHDELRGMLQSDDSANGASRWTPFLAQWSAA